MDRPVFDSDSGEEFQNPKRFRSSKSKDAELSLINNAVPQSTRYTNKARRLYEEWRTSRPNKCATLEETSLGVDLTTIQSLEVDITRMDTRSLDFWLGKFIQEVTAKNGSRYPGKTLYQLVAALKRL